MRNFLLAAVVFFAPVAALSQSAPNDYILVLTEPMAVLNPDGTTTTQPPGTVVDRILWDGVTPYTPPPGEEIQPANGHQIGDIVTP